MSSPRNKTWWNDKFHRFHVIHSCETILSLAWIARVPTVGVTERWVAWNVEAWKSAAYFHIFWVVFIIKFVIYLYFTTLLMSSVKKKSALHLVQRMTSPGPLAARKVDFLQWYESWKILPGHYHCPLIDGVFIIEVLFYEFSPV